MKKVYTKPAIMFEDFTLSTNIAGSCEIKTNTPSSGKCAYEAHDEFLGVEMIFTNKVNACLTTEDDGEYNNICYQVPYGENLFNS